jgi:hypothetical protein
MRTSAPLSPASTNPSPPGVNGIIPAAFAAMNAMSTMAGLGRRPTASSDAYNAM